MKEFKVYDQVWIMYDNKPKYVMIYSVEESMNFSKNGIDKLYKFVPEGRLSADTPCNPALGKSISEMFSSKDKLLGSL